MEKTMRDAARNLKRTVGAQADIVRSSALKEQKAKPSAFSSPEANPLRYIVINENEIPFELKKLKQWVVWKRDIRNGKPTKVPYAVNNVPARADDPAT